MDKYILENLPIDVEVFGEIRHSHNLKKGIAILECSKIIINDNSILKNFKFLIDTSDKRKKYNPGKVHAFGKLYTLPMPKNAGSISFTKYYSSLGLSAKIKFFHGSIITFNKKNNLVYNTEIFNKTRYFVENSISKYFPEQSFAKAVIKSIVLGDTDYIPFEKREIFQKSGAIHLFAISGLHIYIVTLFSGFFFRLFGIKFRYRLVLSLLLMMIYILLTGARPSAVRAGILISILYIGLIIYREASITNSLSIAAIFILLMDTRLLFNVGFQLTFVVVFAIVRISPYISEKIYSFFKPDDFLPKELYTKYIILKDRLGALFSRAFSVSFSAWLASAPIIYLHFKAIYPVGIVINTILAPIAFIILSCSFLAVISNAFFIAPLVYILNFINYYFVTFAIIIATYSSNLSKNIYLLRLLSKKSTYLPQSLNHQFAPKSHYKINIMDIPYGGSANILSWQGKKKNAFLLDFGNKKVTSREISNYLFANNIKNIQGGVVSHKDSNHYGALAFLKNEYGNFPINKEFVDKNFTVKYFNYPSINNTADDNCLITSINIYKWNILYLSDIGYHAESELYKKNIKTDIIIKGWHKKDNKINTKFYQNVNAKIIILSGQSNFENYQNTMKMINKIKENSSAKILFQENTGPVFISISPEKIFLKTHINEITLK